MHLVHFPQVQTFKVLECQVWRQNKSAAASPTNRSLIRSHGRQVLIFLAFQCMTVMLSTLLIDIVLLVPVPVIIRRVTGVFNP
jgi:hypothetical protein